MRPNNLTWDIFKLSNLFHGIPDADYAGILSYGESKVIESKSILFHHGDPAVRCYFIVDGRLKLVLQHELGKEVIIRYIGPGEITAALAVLKEKTYPVTAEIISEANVISWDKRSLRELMLKYPQIAINLLNIAIERLDDVQRRYLELSAEQVEQRIARSLLRIMRHAGSKTSDGVRIDFPITRQDLADYAGTTLYTVSRTLSAWEKRGWVKSKREKITITDPHALVLFSEG